MKDRFEFDAAAIDRELSAQAIEAMNVMPETKRRFAMFVQLTPQASLQLKTSVLLMLADNEKKAADRKLEKMLDGQLFHGVDLPRYAYGIARRMQQAQSRKERGRIQEIDAELADGLQLARSHAPEQIASLEERVALISEAMNRALSPEERDLVKCKLLLNLSYRQIKKAMGGTVTTVALRRRLKVARDRLIRELGPNAEFLLSPDC